MTYHDSPVALLIGRDGYERIVKLPCWPPIPEYRVPRRTRFTAAEPEGDPTMQRNDRVFVLERSLAAAEHRWWMVYNEGRSRTPEAVPVYLERRQS